jgi:hypothetical protein
LDRYGNENSSWFTFTADYKDPLIDLVSPDNGSILNSDFEIEFLIYDLNFKNTMYSKNSNFPKSFYEPHKINTSSWQDGDYNITVFAEDLAGNYAEKWFIFTKDTQNPQIILCPPPENGSLIFELTDLDFEIIDENIETVSYKLNSEPFVSLAYPYEIDSNSWDDGEYIITMRAEDKAGNAAENWFTFRKDTIPPTVSSHSLNDSGKDISIDTDIIIEFTESMDIETVEGATSLFPLIDHSCSWSDNNRTLTITCNGSFSYDTTYRLSISPRAKDLAARGLENRYELEFTTESRPKTAGNYEFPFFIILMLILILLVILLFTAYSRRTRKPSVDYSYIPIDVNRVKQVTCPRCNNINQVKDTGATVNFQCEFCQNNITVHLGQKLPHFQSAREIKTLMQVSCPDCHYVFDVQKSDGLVQVQCPDCGSKGMMR